MAPSRHSLSQQHVEQRNIKSPGVIPIKQTNRRGLSSQGKCSITPRYKLALANLLISLHKPLNISWGDRRAYQLEVSPVSTPDIFDLPHDDTPQPIEILEAVHKCTASVDDLKERFGGLTETVSLLRQDL